MTQFDTNYYAKIDNLRFEHFDTLNINFKGKKILELGSGVGNHTKFILSKKPKLVVAVEGRQSNCDITKERLKGETSLDVICHDLSKGYPAFKEKFDWIYNYGLLYHLPNPFESLNGLRNVKHTNMIFETLIEVSGGENNLNEGDCETQALWGVGSRPNYIMILDKLKELYKNVIFPTQPNDKMWNDWDKNPEMKRMVVICEKLKKK
jgi:SAM-dependent methyltransferase